MAEAIETTHPEADIELALALAADIDVDIEADIELDIAADIDMADADIEDIAEDMDTAEDAMALDVMLMAETMEDMEEAEDAAAAALFDQPPELMRYRNSMARECRQVRTL